MKKTVISFLVGILFATVGSVYAEDMQSLVGKTKKIQAEVSVKVDERTADRVGIIIDGTTYLPVRSIGNALGMDVTYTKTEVRLISKGGVDVEPTTESREMSQEDKELLESTEIEFAKSRERNSKLKGEVDEYEKKIKELDDQIVAESDETKKNQLEFQKNNILNGLRASKSLLEMSDESLLKYEEAINKIKAKYES